MNFIDMAIEYQEALLWNKAVHRPEDDTEDEEERFIDAQIADEEKKTVNLTQEEIDEDYENLNLDEFDENQE